jgi:hypothetical protein
MTGTRFEDEGGGRGNEPFGSGDWTGRRGMLFRADTRILRRVCRDSLDVVVVVVVDLTACSRLQLSAPISGSIASSTF